MYNYDIARMHEKNLSKFIDDAKKISKPDSVAVTKANMLFLIQMRSIVRDFNLVMAQLIVTLRILDKLDAKEFHYLISNLCRIINSLLQQRNFFSALREAASVKEIDAQIKASFTYTINRANNRSKYLRETILPENLALTPIKEYIDLVGEDSFLSAISKIAYNTKELMDFQKSGALQEFAGNILDSVCAAGLENKYKERISAYIELRDKRAAAEKEAAFERKAKVNSDISYAGMTQFHEFLSKAFYTRSGCDLIGITDKNISYAFNSLRGRYIVLRCSVGSRGKYVFHYINRNGVGSSKFINAHKFDVYADAEAFVSKLSAIRTNKGKCFSIYQIGN